MAKKGNLIPSVSFSEMPTQGANTNENVWRKKPASSSKTERVRLGFVEKQVIALLQSRISLNNNKAGMPSRQVIFKRFLDMKLLLKFN